MHFLAHSQPSALGKGDCAIAGNDKMIEHANVDERQRLDLLERDVAIRFARLRDAGRVIVREDHGRRAQAERFLDDLPRIDRRAIQEYSGSYASRLRDGGGTSRNPS